MPPLSVDERIQRVSDVCCISRNSSRLLLEKHAWNCDSAICGYWNYHSIEVQFFWRRTRGNSIKTKGEQKEHRNKGTGDSDASDSDWGRVGKRASIFPRWSDFYWVFWFRHHCGYKSVSGTRMQGASIKKEGANCNSKRKRVAPCTLSFVYPNRSKGKPTSSVMSIPFLFYSGILEELTTR